MSWTLEKIKSCCLIDHKTGCWNWLKAKSTAGYGQIRINDIAIYVHRLVVSLVRGQLPDGTEVCHSCDNPGCVSPEHLYVGNRRSNAGDMVSRGRSAKGEQHSQAKLTCDNAIELSLIHI